MNLDINDLIVRSCREMEKYARSCSSDFVSHDMSCDWYHSSWQYLRAVNCVSAPQWHQDFYVGAFKDCINETKMAKILISGTADYSLLHLIVSTLIDNDACAFIDILDLCATPLQSCRWYANELNAMGYDNIIFVRDKKEIPNPKEVTKNQIVIHTIKSDITKYNVRDEHGTNWKYDVICSDAFLTRFDRKEAGSILEKWSLLLSPQGRIITTVRIHDTETEAKQTVASSSRQMLNFCKNVLDKYTHKDFASARQQMQLEVEELEYKAFRYIVRMKSHSLGRHENIIKLFADCDFQLKTDEVDTVDGEIAKTSYCRIVAQKTDGEDKKDKKGKRGQR